MEGIEMWIWEAKFPAWNLIIYVTVLDYKVLHFKVSIILAFFNTYIQM